MGQITATQTLSNPGFAPGLAEVGLPAPTPEQGAILEVFATGADLVIEAGAGTGKTSTLKMLARTAPGRKGTYLAFNRAIADEAKGSFPWSVKCATAHSLAFQAVGKRYAHRLNSPRLSAYRVAEILGIREFLPVGNDRRLGPRQLARLVMDTVTLYCYSAEHEICPWHVPEVNGLDPRARVDLEEKLVPWAEKAWQDLRSEDEGRLKFAHDHYLKMWQLSEPRLPTDYVLLDEAQDANPVIASVVQSQPCQQVLVGDSAQQIYQWRGAVDAMVAENFTGRRLPLSQSFRFGPAIAEEANKWLRLLGAHLQLRGHEPIASRLEALEKPMAVLCRTNAETVAQALQYQLEERQVALVGGGVEIRRLAEAAIPLQRGQSCEHPELFLFKDWEEVREFASEDKAGADLQVFVKLIDAHGPDQVIRTIDRLASEEQAQVVVSTAHKAKGREWATVQIANDFEAPEEGKPVDPGELRLAYVAVTRAKEVLDRGGLAWIDGYLTPPED